MSLDSQLAHGLQALNLNNTAALRQALIGYLRLLQKWNRHFNLTAIDQAEEIVSHHLLDSLSIVPYIQGERVLDMGSGAGLPGIPLALYFPHISFTLLDSNGKKTRFLQQAAAELALVNVTVVKTRIQDYRPAQGFDTVLSRALSQLETLYTMGRPLCQPGACLLAMKGRYPHEELRALHAIYQGPVQVHALLVPGLAQAARHAVCLTVVETMTTS